MVDDGSTDGSGAICDQLSGEDDRIKVIHKANEGLSAARNTGLDLAKGEYIGLVDSDDYVSIDMYEKLLVLLQETKAEMAVCSFSYEDENSGAIWSSGSPLKDEKLSPDQYIKRWMASGRPWYYVVAWNRLYKKELFENLRYPEGKWYEDEFVIHRLVLRCTLIISSEESLYYYVQREGSITHEKSRLKYLDYIGALLDRYNLAREKDNAVLKVWSLKKAAYELYKLGEYAHSSLKYKQNYSAYKKTFARLLRYELFHVNGGLSIAEKIWITVRFLFPGAIRAILSFLENRKTGRQN